MGLFNLFRKKENIIEKLRGEIFDKVFPEGKQQLEREVCQLEEILNKKYSRADVQKAYMYVSCMYYISEDKSQNSIVRSLLRSSNKNIQSEDANTLYTFVFMKVVKHETEMLKRQTRVSQQTINRLSDFLARQEQSQSDIQTRMDGIDFFSSDEFPDIDEDFGYSISSPIMANGILASHGYLNRLRTLDNQPIKWNRTGSINDKYFTKPVDIYQITNLSGKEICTLYLYMYVKIISERAPKGFKLVTN